MYRYGNRRDKSKGKNFAAVGSNVVRREAGYVIKRETPADEKAHGARRRRTKIEAGKQENHFDDIPFLEEWEAFGMKPFIYEDEYCLIREVEYPLSHRHGLYSFSELEEVITLWNQSGLSHTLSAKGYNKNNLFFFDTETTGLGGGAGNTIFCLGMREYMKTE